MFWCEKIAERLKDATRTVIINDSKTPSGRVHVGALRGVLIHDAVFRTLKATGIPAVYRFGVDDYDPVDEIPFGQNEHFEQYLGAPLCNVPPPPGSDAPDMAEHFIREFFEIFKELGVETESYRMRDIYRSGQFNEAIDTILQQAATVREIYLKVSGAERPANWLPFQVVCENCGRVGTTEVTAYENGEVVYHCRPDLVTWATGCGYQGKTSPFDGRGKLPWKLEWVAKWHSFPVAVEGAGKDHSTKGGSRDVAANCLKRIFGEKPPVNIPYEFFLVGGAKMSSSKGIGVSAREMANLLPPEVLRFLMLRTQPQRPVNFMPDEKNIIKLFNDYDRTHHRVYHDPNLAAEQRAVFALSDISAAGDYYDAGFQLVVTLAQMPHLDPFAEVARQKGAPLTDVERRQLERRLAAARVWVENYAAEEEKTIVRDTLPERARELSAAPRAFLQSLAQALETVEWEAETLQTCIFETARATPLRPGQAFQTIYRVILDRTDGPRAGNLLAFLDRDFVLSRFRELPVDQRDVWRETGETPESFFSWKEKNAAKISGIEPECLSPGTLEGEAPFPAVVDCRITLESGKIELHRVLIEISDAGEQAVRNFMEQAAQAGNNA